MKRMNDETLADVLYFISIGIFLVLFTIMGYKGGYDIAKTEDALMCVRDCMPYPYNQ